MYEDLTWKDKLRREYEKIKEIIKMKTAQLLINHYYF